MRTRLQGSTLASAHLQGAELWDASLQGADLNRAHMEGIHYDAQRHAFRRAHKILEPAKNPCHMSAIFEGGLSREDVNSLVEGLPNENAKERLLREKTEPTYRQARKKTTAERPADAITGAYTEKEAEQWIAEYEEAMSEVPKADNG